MEEGDRRGALLPERFVEAHGDAHDRAGGELAQGAALFREAQRTFLQYAERQRNDGLLGASFEALAGEGAGYAHCAAPPFHAGDRRAKVQARAARHDRVREPAHQRAVAALRPRLGGAEGAAAPFLDDGFRADAARVGGVEALDHHARQGLRLLRHAPVREELVEGHVLLQLGLADRALRFRECVYAPQAALRKRALLANRVYRAKARLLEKRVGHLRFAVDELGAELDRDLEARHAARPAAAADALARLQHENRFAGAHELVRGGKARRSGADHNYVIHFS